jgi:hypothetical protein
VIWIHSQHPQEHADIFPSPVQALQKVTTSSDEIKVTKRTYFHDDHVKCPFLSESVYF